MYNIKTFVKYFVILLIFSSIFFWSYKIYFKDGEEKDQTKQTSSVVDQTYIVANQQTTQAERKKIFLMNGPAIEHRTELINEGDYKCIIIYGATKTTGADLTVFGDRAFKHYKTVPKKLPNDIWAFFGKEPQTKVGQPQSQMKWDGMFNYSATFHRNNEANSHIFRAQLMRISPPNTHYFRPKPKMLQLRALWFISHCTEPGRTREVYSAREEYALELSKYIQIDVFTSAETNLCTKRFGSLVKPRSIDNEPEMDDYIFYLAFENSLCQDYISEKLWKVLESNSTTIPIALGGSSIEDYEYVAPPNSFIHVKNFTSPETLAKHLKFVSEDDNAFHYYNQWRNEVWLKTKHIQNIPTPRLYHGDFMEHFCKLIYERPQKVWHTFSKDFNREQCRDVSKPKDHCLYYNLPCNL